MSEVLPRAWLVVPVGCLEPAPPISIEIGCVSSFSYSAVEDLDAPAGRFAEILAGQHDLELGALFWDDTAYQAQSTRDLRDSPS